jgi:hypothetical protein
MILFNQLLSLKVCGMYGKRAFSKLAYVNMLGDGVEVAPKRARHAEIFCLDRNFSHDIVGAC